MSAIWSHAPVFLSCQSLCFLTCKGLCWPKAGQNHNLPLHQQAQQTALQSSLCSMIEHFGIDKEWKRAHWVELVGFFTRCAWSFTLCLVLDVLLERFSSLWIWLNVNDYIILFGTSFWYSVRWIDFFSFFLFHVFSPLISLIRSQRMSFLGLCKSLVGLAVCITLHLNHFAESLFYVSKFWQASGRSRLQVHYRIV